MSTSLGGFGFGPTILWVLWHHKPERPSDTGSRWSHIHLPAKERRKERRGDGGERWREGGRNEAKMAVKKQMESREAFPEDGRGEGGGQLMIRGVRAISVQRRRIIHSKKKEKTKNKSMKHIKRFQVTSCLTGNNKQWHCNGSSASTRL